MELTPDELAGVVDVLGPVTRDELEDACGELAFKRGSDSATIDIQAALESYHLVAVADHGEDTDDTILVVGPAAFPALPDGVEDLPHILDVPSRSIDTGTTAAAAEKRFRDDAATAIENSDANRITSLLDVSYELEAWGPVELDRARERLDEATD
jgi:hypothetical protein